MDMANPPDRLLAAILPVVCVGANDAANMVKRHYESLWKRLNAGKNRSENATVASEPYFGDDQHMSDCSATTDKWAKMRVTSYLGTARSHG
jgi:hypothetical protein